MDEFLLLTLCASVFFIIGWLLYGKQRIELIAKEYRKNVPKEQEAEYARGIGSAFFIMGVGMILTGGIDVFTNRELGWYAFGFCFFLCIAKVISTQIRYNGGFEMDHLTKWI